MPPAYARYFRPLRPRGRALWHMLPWWGRLDDGVVLLKHRRSLLRCFHLRGHDWHGIPDEVIAARQLQASEALRKLGGGEFQVQTEAQRREALLPPVAPGPYPIATQIAQQRRQDLQAPPGVWESLYMLALTWTPDLAQRQGDIRPRQVSAFVDQADDFFGHLQGTLAAGNAMTSPEQLTYLHSTVSDQVQPVAVPEDDTFLDQYLCDSVWSAGSYGDGWDARLGAWHVRLCTITGYPGVSWANMMQRLNNLPLGYRWCTSWTKIESYLHRGLLHELQRSRLEQESTARQKLRQRFFQKDPRILDESAHRDVEDLSALRQELGANMKALGRFSTRIMTWGATAEEADGNLRRILHALRGEGFVVKPEGRPGELLPHHVAAWFATHPGTGDHGTRLLQTSVTVAHLWPGLQAANSGPTRDRFFPQPWLYAQTDEHTLLRLVNHVRDVGHFLMVGPTGSGKTTFANLLRALWMLNATHYPQLQCITMDMKRGGRLLTHLLGGQWFDLGQLNFRLQPLRDLDTPTDMSMASHWIKDYLADKKVEITGEVDAYVDSNLRRLRELPLAQRTLTALVAAMSDHTRPIEQRMSREASLIELVKLHNTVKTALQPLTERGQYGHIFDADRNSVDVGRVVTFELETLIDQHDLIGPILRYIYPRIYRRMSTDAPMLLLNDDAAIPWAVERIQKQSEDWLRLTRDKAVSMGFLTHSIVDLFSGAMGKLLVASCPTRFLLPNPAAMGRDEREGYQRLSLPDAAIRQIALARPQHDVFWQVPELGQRLLQVPLSPFVQACCARNSAADHRVMDAILQQDGPEGFREAWLRHHGYHTETTAWIGN